MTEIRNETSIICPKCPCLILKPNQAYVTRNESGIKLTSILAEDSGKQCEIDEFWTINHHLTFENIGVSNAVNNIAYLICANCELGPLGYRDMNDKDKFYLDVKRVKYK
jgi:hypothetical protein